MKHKIAIYGSAVDENPDIMGKAHELSVALAKHTDEIILITGGCPGIPDVVVQNAHKTSGIEAWAFCSSVDIAGQKELFPTVDVNAYHKLFYVPKNLGELFHSPETGMFEVNTHVRHKYRNVNSAAVTDAAIIISGRWGTLNEFTSAIDMGKIIGVYTGTGGIADELGDLQKKIRKKTAGVALYEENPHKLIQTVLDELRTKSETK